MKPPTIFLGELTSVELEAFLQEHHTLIVPVGAVEQHGPHSALLTDVLIPTEIARRVAPRLGALVAPPVHYALSYPHTGFAAVAQIRIPTFMALIEDLCATFADMGMKRIIFLNGHYDNAYAIAYACANARPRLPKDCRAYPINYWDGIPSKTAAQWSGLERGLHAHAAEASCLLAINPALVDPEKLNQETPQFPKYDIENISAVHLAYFISNPGSMHWITRSGTWGDARTATAQKGEEYLALCARSTELIFREVERTFATLPPDSPPRA
jgi:creatinine amidohydrolase